jgi:undecaprenyl pyrophosphate phosphatase UppP
MAPLPSTKRKNSVPHTDPVLQSLTFDVALHLGTLLAQIVFFAADLALGLQR